MDLDTFSKSDPIIHVFLKDGKLKQYTLIGKTEMVLNNLNPDFTKTFTIDYYFEKEQWIKFQVYDVDETELEHIGDCETTLAKIMTSNKTTFISDLNLPNSSASRGKIVVRADSVAQSNDDIQFRARATLNESKGGCLCGSDNPYLLIQRARQADSAARGGDFIRVHQTPSMPNSRNP